MARMFFDSHVHFAQADGEHGAAALIERARAAGVGRMIAVGGSPQGNHHAVEVARGHPREVAAAIGFDRDQAGGLFGSAGGIDAAMAELKALIRAAPAPVAIGEIGLDFHYHPETTQAQVELFARQLALARELKLPAIVHSREADEPTIVALQAHAGEWNGPPDAIGVLHCFTGTEAFARRLLEIGCHISFSGIVTFRNADALRAVARMVPDDRLLIETDTPYLAPVPRRGRRNEPAFLPHVAAKLAEVRGCSVERIANLTTANAERLFRRPCHEGMKAQKKGGRRLDHSV
jgi:TatD DNase family protein